MSMDLRLADILLAEFDRETAVTRHLLAVAPESRSGWRPKDHAPTLGDLVTEVAARPADLVILLQASSLDRRARHPAAVPFTSMTAALKAFDAAVARSRSVLAAASDTMLTATVTLVDEHGVGAAHPRLEALRALGFNRMIHERGQLSVYLRLCDVRLPPIYGPAIDPPPM